MEGSVATVAVLLKNGDFVIPPFERILPGTTAIKILEYIESDLLDKSPSSFPKDYLKRIVRREILISEAKAEACEVMFLGGEECVPVLEWDGEPVDQGKKGPAA